MRCRGWQQIGSAHPASAAYLAQDLWVEALEEIDRDGGTGERGKQMGNSCPLLLRGDAVRSLQNSALGSIRKRIKRGRKA